MLEQPYCAEIVVNIYAVQVFTYRGIQQYNTINYVINDINILGQGYVRRVCCRLVVTTITL